MANTIINVNDLGYLYSILALDYLKREKIREVPFWSSKIEVSFLQHDYHKTLVEL